MAPCFLFSLCMHSALVHHLPHSLASVNVVATSFYLPSVRQSKSIRTEADFQIFHGPSLAAIPEIIAIKKFKIYLRNITFIGHLFILHSRLMQRTPLGVHTFVRLAKPGRLQCFLCGSIGPTRVPQPARPAASLHCDAVPKATKYHFTANVYVSCKFTVYLNGVFLNVKAGNTNQCSSKGLNFSTGGLTVISPPSCVIPTSKFRTFNLWIGNNIFYSVPTRETVLHFGRICRRLGVAVLFSFIQTYH